MGQDFTACAYDIENRKSCNYFAAKFHANCYSFSGAVLSMHYLLRQAPYRKSLSLGEISMSNFVIDPVPVLTETGGGSIMAYDEGITIESTEDLAGTWCGDLLQIVEILPEDYEVINFCIAEQWSRAEYCYKNYGVNKDMLLLIDDNGTIFKSTYINLRGNRGVPISMQVKKDGKEITYTEVPVPS